MGQARELTKNNGNKKSARIALFSNFINYEKLIKLDGSECQKERNK